MAWLGDDLYDPLRTSRGRVAHETNCYDSGIARPSKTYFSLKWDKDLAIDLRQDFSVMQSSVAFLFDLHQRWRWHGLCSKLLGGAYAPRQDGVRYALSRPHRFSRGSFRGQCQRLSRRQQRAFDVEYERDQGAACVRDDTRPYQPWLGQGYQDRLPPLNRASFSFRFGAGS